jgi:hypothetical protein
MDWIDVTQDGGKWLVVVNAVMNFLVPVNVGNFLSTQGPVRFFRKTAAWG